MTPADPNTPPTLLPETWTERYHRFIADTLEQAILQHQHASAAAAALGLTTATFYRYWTKTHPYPPSHFLTLHRRAPSAATPPPAVDPAAPTPPSPTPPGAAAASAPNHTAPAPNLPAQTPPTITSASPQPPGHHPPRPATPVPPNAEPLPIEQASIITLLRVCGVPDSLLRPPSRRAGHTRAASFWRRTPTELWTILDLARFGYRRLARQYRLQHGDNHDACATLTVAWTRVQDHFRRHGYTLAG